MTTAAILLIPTEKDGILYRGVAGDKHSEGSTVGEALDADQFFNAAQQSRLAELMHGKNTALNRGNRLGTQEQAELDTHH